MLEVDGSDKPANTRLALILDADANVKWTVRLLGSGLDPSSQQHAIIVSFFFVVDDEHSGHDGQ